MPASIGSLNVDLSIGTARFESGLASAQGKLNGVKTKMADTAATSRSIGAGFDVVRAAAIGMGTAIVGGAARSFLSLADESKNLNAQLTLATAKLGTLSQAQADVARIASTTRESLTATANLYGNFLRATSQLGGSQADAARATETFGKALKIGGADANAAASATLQFGQALASGALRGDEFNSIAEASPRILSLLADAMGVSQGSVRALAAEGKLTSDVLFKALTDRKFTAGIDTEFNQLPVTFDQAMTLVHNAAVTTFGAFDSGGQFSTMFADFIGRGADGFANLGKSAEQFGRDTRSVMAGLGNVFDPLETGGYAVLDSLGVKIRSVSDQIYSLLQSFDRVGAAAAGVANFINAPGNLARRLAGKPETTVYAPNNAERFKSGMKVSAAQLRRDASARRLEGLGYVVPRNKDGSINEAGIKKVERVAPIANTPPPKKTGGRGGGGGGKRAGGGASKAERPEWQAIVDGLLPDEARAKDLQTKSDTLGKALAAGLLPLDVYQRATAAIGEQMEEFYAKTRTATGLDKAELDVGKVTAVETDGATGKAVGDALKNAKTGFLDFRSILDGLRDDSGGTFERMTGDILDGLIPALGDASGALSQMGSQADELSQMFTSLFGSILGKKGVGGFFSKVLGAAAGAGVNAGLGQTSSRRIPGFKTGGSFTIGGQSGIDSNLVMFRGSVGEHVNVTKGNDGGPTGSINIHMPITYQGAVDIADKAYVQANSAQTKSQVMSAVTEAQRRRAGR